MCYYREIFRVLLECIVLINICIKTVAAEDSLCWLRDFRPADFTCGTVTGLQPEEEDYPRVLSPDL